MLEAWAHSSTMATQSTRFLPGRSASMPDIEHGNLMRPSLPRPNSLTRQTTVLLNDGVVVKATVSFQSQNHMDIHAIQEMMTRWRERSAVIENVIGSQSLSHDDIFIYQSEWTNLVRRMNAAQALLDLLHPMEV